MALSLPQTPPLVSLTGNDIKFTVETTSSAQELYGLFIQVQESDREDPEAWSDIGPEMRAPADVNNQGTFKIQEILKKLYTDHIETPSTELVAERDYVRKYRVKYYEKYGASQTAYTITYSSAFYAIEGGIGHLTEKKYEALGSNWYEQIVARKGFLSNMPSHKITNEVIGDAYREKLWFYNYAGLRTLVLKVRIYYPDNPSSVTTVFTHPTAKDHYIYEIEASYRKLGIDITNALAYEVWIDNSGTPATESRFYKVDTNYNRRLKYFAYFNNYGLSESLICTGEYSGSSKYTKGESVSLLTKETTEENIHEDVVRAASTGLIKRNWFIHLREFYGARKKYEYLFSSQINSFLLVPIIFESKKLPEPGSEDVLFNHSFKYRFAFSSEYNDNILFVSKEVTFLKLKEIIEPLPGADDVSVNFNDAEAELHIHGRCYSGGGVIWVKQSTDDQIVLTLNFEDCELTYNEAEDYTAVRFVLGHWILSAYYGYYIELSFNMFKNKNQYFMEPITTLWNFETVD